MYFYFDSASASAIALSVFLITCTLHICWHASSARALPSPCDHIIGLRFICLLSPSVRQSLSVSGVRGGGLVQTSVPTCIIEMVAAHISLLLLRLNKLLPDFGHAHIVANMSCAALNYCHHFAGDKLQQF